MKPSLRDKPTAGEAELPEKLLWRELCGRWSLEDFLGRKHLSDPFVKEIGHLDDEEAEEAFDNCILDIVDSGELLKEFPSEDEMSSGM